MGAVTEVGRGAGAPASGAWAWTAFAPHADLAALLLPHAVGPARDASHDEAHVLRVWRAARRIQAAEGGDLEVVAAACILHDCEQVEKSSPRRSLASRLSARRASGILEGIGWAPGRVEAACHAIEAHSYSARIEPLTLEARIVQDADRLDSLGMVGVARCLMTGERIGRPLRVEGPDHDDEEASTLGHLRSKVLGLASTMRTATGAAMARERHARVARFLAEIEGELDGVA